MKKKMESLRNRFDAMKVGEVMAVSFDDYAYRTIRSYASERGLVLGRVYSTQLSRETRCIFVTRKS